MNVSDQIIQVLDHLCEKFGLVIDWTSENVLPYVTTLCTKLVTYEIWTSVAWMAIFCILSIIGFVVVKRLCPIFKAGRDQDNIVRAVDWEVGSGFALVGVIIFYIIACIVIVTQIMDIIQCVTFPEMYVFEYAQKVLNSGG